MEELNKFQRFVALKNEVNVPKGVYNNFGKFWSRSKEDIQKTIKPLEVKYNILINVDDGVVFNGEKTIIQAVATAKCALDGELITTAKSYAEVQPMGTTKMNESQLYGSASSYAGKYALGNLLGLDDNKDGDDEGQGKPKVRKPLGMKPVEQDTKPVVNVDDSKTALYEIGQATLKVTTPEEINELIDKLEKLGGNDRTTLVLNTKAKQLGFKQNIKTKKWGKINV